MRPPEVVVHVLPRLRSATGTGRGSVPAATAMFSSGGPTGDVEVSPRRRSEVDDRVPVGVDDASAPKGRLTWPDAVPEVHVAV
jgi:hypothetical protein